MGSKQQNGDLLGEITDKKRTFRAHIKGLHHVKNEN